MKEGNLRILWLCETEYWVMWVESAELHVRRKSWFEEMNEYWKMYGQMAEDTERVAENGLEGYAQIDGGVVEVAAGTEKSGRDSLRRK